MATKRDLEAEVERLNKKYCKSGKNEFAINQAYGGYEVVLTGKKRKNGEPVKGSLGTGVVSITDGHDTATKTIDAIFKSESRNWLQSQVKYYKNRK